MDIILLILKLAMAIFPPLLLMVITYWMDWKEKEPFSLLCTLFLFGIGSFFISYLWEMIGYRFLINRKVVGLFGLFLRAFFVVGVGEEIAKFGMLSLCSWKHKAFDYRFDGIVYAVYVSLGFATAENIAYVWNAEMAVAFLRGISSIPLHASCGVIMGIFYGLAKEYAYMHNERRKRQNVGVSILIPIILHGFYDFSMVTNSYAMSMIWILFTVFLFVIVLNRLIRHSVLDHKIIVEDNKTTALSYEESGIISDEMEEM